MNSIVYFTREITPEKVLELYKRAVKDLPGKVAIKLHSGEKAIRISWGLNSGSRSSNM